MNSFFEKNGATLSRQDLKEISGGKPPMGPAKCCWDNDPGNCSGCVGYHGTSCYEGSHLVHC